MYIYIYINQINYLLECILFNLSTQKLSQSAFILEQKEITLSNIQSLLLL